MCAFMHRFYPPFFSACLDLGGNTTGGFKLRPVVINCHALLARIKCFNWMWKPWGGRKGVWNWHSFYDFLWCDTFSLLSELA